MSTARKGLPPLTRAFVPALLVAPLFLFLVVFFFLPIAATLWQSVSDPLVGQALPKTIASLKGQTLGTVPGDDTFQNLGTDLADGYGTEILAKAAGRLNSDAAGFRSLIMKTARHAKKSPLTARAAFETIDPTWGRAETWSVIARAAGPLTDANLLGALDLKRDDRNAIVSVPAQDALFISMLVRTIVMALSVTLICLLIGFPYAYYLAASPPGRQFVLMIFVLLPLWSSILVRSLSWTVLLQREGVVNGLLASLGLSGAPFDLMFNRGAVYTGMTHILLPFMVLALYGPMKSLAPVYLRASSSLGAAPFTTFRRIYLPLVMPGILSGCLLVFIQALGAYITPVLLGGPEDQTIAPIIAFYVLKSSNIPLAAALSLILLVAIVLLSLVYRAIAGPRKEGVF